MDIGHLSHPVYGAPELASALIDNPAEYLPIVSTAQHSVPQRAAAQHGTAQRNAGLCSLVQRSPAYRMNNPLPAVHCSSTGRVARAWLQLPPSLCACMALLPGLSAGFCTICRGAGV